MAVMTTARITVCGTEAYHHFDVRKGGAWIGRVAWYARIDGEYIQASAGLQTVDYADAEDALTALLGFASCAADEHSTDRETWLSVRSSFGDMALAAIDDIGAEELALVVSEREDDE
jgi:hypothetical protein